MAKRVKPEPKSVRWDVPQLSLELQNILDALPTYADREMVIMGHSLLEATMEDLARSRLVSDHDPALFSDGRPFGSFWGLYTLLHAAGWIPSELRKALQNINTIRNLFAHSFRGNSFQDDAVIAECGGLKIIETWESALLEFVAAPLEKIEGISADSFSEGLGVRSNEEIHYVAFADRRVFIVARYAKAKRHDARTILEASIKICYIMLWIIQKVPVAASEEELSPPL